MFSKRCFFPVYRISVYRDSLLNWFSWELSKLSPDSRLNDGVVEGGEMQVATLGLNWWLTPFFSMNVGYKYIWNEQHGQKAESSGLLTRLILVLE